jgi:hypothetical protein
MSVIAAGYEKSNMNRLMVLKKTTNLLAHDFAVS